MYRWVNGDVYDGEFMRNVKHGHGKLTKARG